MPAAFLQRVATAYIASGTPTSLTIPVATATAAGASLLVGIWLPTTGTITSVGPDTQGNTYALEKAGTLGSFVYRSNLSTALTTSDSIPVSFTAGANHAAFAVVDAFTGLGTFDASVASTVSSNASMSLNVTATASDQVIYGLAFMDESGSGSYSTSSPFTACGTPLSTYNSGTNYNALGLSAYDPSPSAGTVTFPLSNPGSHSGVMFALAYPPAGSYSGSPSTGVVLGPSATGGSQRSGSATTGAALTPSALGTSVRHSSPSTGVILAPSCTGSMGTQSYSGSPSTGIIITPSAAGTSKRLGSPSTGPHLVPSALGTSVRHGSVTTGVTLGPSSTGGSAGSVTTGVHLVPSCAGGSQRLGSSSSGVHLVPTAAGASRRLGSVTAGVQLAPTSTGASRRLGSPASGLHLTPACTGLVGASSNLILSLAPAAGVDGYGNAYPEGLGVSRGQIPGTLLNAASVPATAVNFTARSIGGITTTVAATAPSGALTDDLWIDTASGNAIYQYSGSAWVLYQFGSGSIAANSISAAQIVANTITASQIAAGTITATQIAANTITAAKIAANTITASQLAAGIIYAGIINGTTVNAGTFTGSVFEGTDFIINSSGAFFYSSTPASGNLITSITAAAGTDGFGNAYPAGLTVGTVADTQLQMYSSAGVGRLVFPLNNAAFTNGLLESGIVGTTGELVLNGPKNTVAGFTDFVGVEYDSSDGISTSATLQIVYNDPTPAAHLYAYAGSSGFVIESGWITCVLPGTGTSPSNPAVNESIHSLSGLLAGNWAVRTGGYIAQYYLLPFPWPNGRLQVDFELTITPTVSGTSTLTTALPSGWWPLHHHDIPVAWNSTAAPVNCPTVNLSTAGVLTAYNLPTGTSLLQFSGSFPMN